ncbi:alpha-E domain-containing protein [Sapientia aquatica]|uniref:Alpha-E domain-containing protein n=1 Tax=Sapientia aquatica TaxID=1549640 RepID=A0A4R5VYC5_9BURK|nr:alpha-E domain-containing protein [Sapientia aquatica]TDK64495.1 alpha-E domain-containing protein [Sapientia aquatica]
MLSSTADHLFWMARYTERAENTARMLDVNLENSLMPQSPQAVEQGWLAQLKISELEHYFFKKYDKVNQKNVIDFMVRDVDNPSSIASCLKAARENARAVRGSLTTEVWETENITWLMLQDHFKANLHRTNPSQFFEWVKFRSHLSRGVTFGTMLQDESFNFIRLGTFLERADNTARILDVKFMISQIDHPTDASTEVNPQAEFYYWAALLRSVSAFEIYRKVYRDVITPERVAELLMLQPGMPRSLVACVQGVVENLKPVRNDISVLTEQFSQNLFKELEQTSIEKILEFGLHAYLIKFLENINELGVRLSNDFLVPMVPQELAIAS